MFVLSSMRSDCYDDSIHTFLSPEPVVSWSRGLETRGQSKPSGSGDENGILMFARAAMVCVLLFKSDSILG